MAYEDLLKSVEESAREKEQELRDKSAAAIEDIRTRAAAQAEAIRKGHIEEADRSITTERNRLLYLTRAENKEQMIHVRENAFENAFREAESRLTGLRSDPEYPAVFEKLLREAVGMAGDPAFTVHVDPKDEELCKKTLAALHLASDVSTDIATRGV